MAPAPVIEEPDTTITRLLLVGDAGSGKTTTLHYGALMLAEDYKQGNSVLSRAELDLHCQDRPLPVYIRLTLALTYLREKYRHDRARLTNSAADLLLEWVDFDLPRQVAAPEFPPHLISEKLKAGGCLVLLDGLDETGDAEERGYVKLLINNLVRACPQNRYIVASRPFDGVGQGLTGFLERRLSPLDSDEIQRLLRQWFNAAQQAETPARRTRRSAAQEYEELWGKLEATPRLFDMATNPLLLTSMAVLVHGGDPLPPERAKIYHRLIALTLVRWREAQIRTGQPPESNDQPVRLYAEESDDDVRLRLQQLAAWMLQHQRREILLREAQDLLGPVYSTNRNWLPERSRNHVQALLRLLALHSGLLQERDQGYSFIHFTLQEYLTARDYDERGDIAGLLAVWPRPAGARRSCWRSVTGQPVATASGRRTCLARCCAWINRRRCSWRPRRWMRPTRGW
ncbi:MAG: NACHT domain-containing protein [Kouleothrix sp.]|nr:NACHT domain-containing protein [Kouleothrix sp.]